MKISWAATILALSLVGPMASTTTTTLHALADETLPPLLLDLVIAVDESKSMKVKQTLFQENVGFIFDRLTASVPDLFRVGLVGFGSSVNGGAPRMVQALTKDVDVFLHAFNNSIEEGGGSVEPGYRAVLQIANNNVGVSSGQPKHLNGTGYPGIFPGEAGFCVILISGNDSDGSEAMDDTAALLNKTKGKFFAISGFYGYNELAERTSGKNFPFSDFFYHPTTILDVILKRCLKIVNQTLAPSTDVCALPDNYTCVDETRDKQYCTLADIVDYHGRSDCQCALDVHGNHVCISNRYSIKCGESCNYNWECGRGTYSYVCVTSSSACKYCDPDVDASGNVCAFRCEY